MIELGDVAFVTKLAGFEHTKYIQPNARPQRIKHDDVPMFIGKNIKNGKLTDDIHWFLPKEISLGLERSSLVNKCIVLPYVGSVGDLAIYDKIERHHLASNVAKIELSENAPFSLEYLYYYLKSPFGQNQLLFYIQGGIQKNITMKAIRKTQIALVSNEERVVKTLSDLDAKIELNNKINAELESMAKLIYDYWFVQFDFPDENGKPYKSSGGEMVYSEELKREIPQGWESCLLGDVLDRTGTGLNPRKHFVLGSGDNFYVTIKNIQQGKVILDNKCDKINNEALEIINKRSDLNVGDILFTSIQPVGVTYLLHEKPINWNINESVFTIRPNSKVTSELLYMFLSGDYIKAYTNNVSAGSIHKGIRHSTLKECKFILPHRSLIEKFTEKVQPILCKLHLIDKENQKLVELREWLLPLLMNGQVTIKD